MWGFVHRLTCIIGFVRRLIVWFLVTFPDILTIIFPLLLPPFLFPIRAHPWFFFCFQYLITSTLLFPSFVLRIPWQWSLFTLMVSVVSPGYIFTSEDLELWAMMKESMTGSCLFGWVTSLNMIFSAKQYSVLYMYHNFIIHSLLK